MNISIIGCGNAGSTIGADLALKGHNITLVKSSSSNIHSEHYSFIRKNNSITIEDSGIENTAKINVTVDLKSSVENADLLIIYIQTNYHESLIKRICEYISDGQTVIIEPGYLSTCFFLKYTNKDITIIEAESSPIDCRIVEPGKVKVLFKNTCNPFGVYPKSHINKATEILNQLKYPYIFTDSVVEAALHNPNLIVHTIGAIFSTPRIEYVLKHGGTYSMYKEVFTPHIWNLVLALDNEKMNVLASLGLSRLPYVEVCKQRNSEDEDRDATEVFFDYANNSSPDGPYEPNSRYITEDVSQGLVMLESLGKVLEIATPICSSLIDIASSMLNIDFRKNGRTVDILNRDTIKLIASDSNKN